jgi:hypothetical protein
MKIIIDEPVKDKGHIFICNTEADIEVNASLTSTAGKVYILGKTVIVNSNVKSETSDVKICGIEELTTSDGIKIKGINVNVGAAHFPSSFMSGNHITANVLEAIGQ